ncbi:hypothetical protein E4T56_gene20616 [Termitomyces sp. T112]|nr:hypothetical protein E4T56_gene20616 [Termitomyces sp. T112]
MEIPVLLPNMGETQDFQEYFQPAIQSHVYEESYPSTATPSRAPPPGHNTKTDDLPQGPTPKREESRLVRPYSVDSRYSRFVRHPDRRVAGTRRILRSNLPPRQRERVYHECRLPKRKGKDKHRAPSRHFSHPKNQRNFTQARFPETSERRHWNNTPYMQPAFNGKDSNMSHVQSSITSYNGAASKSLNDDDMDVDSD